MASYICNCNKPADYFVSQINQDGNLTGLAYAACHEHAGDGLEFLLQMGNTTTTNARIVRVTPEK